VQGKGLGNKKARGRASPRGQNRLGGRKGGERKEYRKKKHIVIMVGSREWKQPADPEKKQGGWVGSSQITSSRRKIW